MWPPKGPTSLKKAQENLELQNEDFHKMKIEKQISWKTCQKLTVPQVIALQKMKTNTRVFLLKQNQKLFFRIHETR